MSKTLHGIVRGRTIELTEDLGIAEGQEVEVCVTIVTPQKPLGEGFLRTAGALSDDSEWDGIMKEVQQDRQLDRRPQLDE